MATTRAAASATAAPTATADVAMAAHGVEAPIDSVPWSDVGPGWMLAMWSPVPGGQGGEEGPPGAPTYQTASTTLYLVNPAGGRYAITTFAPPGDGPSPSLVDWSGDGSRALFYEQGSDQGTVIEVDLRSGGQTAFTVDGFDTTPRYTRPEGKAVLLVKPNDVDGPASLERVDRAGNHQLRYPVEQLESDFNAEYLSTRDGKELVLGTDTGLVLMGNDGSVGTALPVAPDVHCTPSRWWDTDATIAVAVCSASDYSYSRLWLVPIDGRRPTALTAPNNPQDSNYFGAETAWQLPAGTFVQALGPCGYKYLAEVSAVGGAPTKVSVPNVDSHSSVIVVGVNGDNLTLQATVSCGTGQSLLTYHPASGTSTVLLGEAVNGGGVDAALAYPGQE